MSKTAVLIIGIQGSGKGTQSINLAEHFAIPHISTGDLLRQEIKAETELGMKVKANLDRGELVPDDVIEEMVTTFLDKGDISHGFIFDGFPRNLLQAEFFMNLMADKGYEVKVLNLHVSDEAAVLRMSERGREDDTPEIIKKRIELFHSETKPLLEYFEKHEAAELIMIDGELTIDGVFQEILQKLGK